MRRDICQYHFFMLGHPGTMSCPRRPPKLVPYSDKCPTVHIVNDNIVFSDCSVMLDCPADILYGNPNSEMLSHLPSLKYVIAFKG